MPSSPAKSRLADRDVRRIAQAVTDLKSAESREGGTDLRKLLESVNSASQAARNAWLGYLGVLAYLVITLAGVSHKDLLLNAPTRLPFAGVEIPLTGFSLFAPTVLLFFMFGILLQHHMLYEKLAKLRKELPSKSESDDTPDVRDEIHSYFFTQAVVGRRHNRKAVLIAYRAMLFVTLTAAPMVVLLYFQTTFLPYHSESMTWWHRAHVIVSALVLWWVGSDLPEMDQDLRDPCCFGVVRKVRTTLSSNWQTIRSFGEGLIGTLRILPDRSSDPQKRLTEWFEYNVPLTPETRTTADNFGQRLFCQTIGIRTRIYARRDSLPKPVRNPGVFVSCLVLLSVFATSVPDRAWDSVASAAVPKWLVPLDDWVEFIGGSRNLVVIDQDLVKDKKVVKGEFMHSLRGRDLRYADFSRSDLKQIDLESAKLQHANLVSTDLRGSRLQKAELQGANLGKAKLQGADLGAANLQGAILGEARLQGADLGEAKLQGADLRAAWLQGADLRLAKLQGAKLGWAKLQGANLGEARLQRADLRWARFQGADLRLARLQGANFRAARLQGANLRLAQLQTADLRWAKLEGANLRWARLEGADLRAARIWLSPTNKRTMKSSFDARSITIDWPGINARENARKVVSDLEELANDMQRDKTPGSRRIAFTLDHVTRKLRPLLVMTTRGELIDSKDSICALHTLRDRKPSLGKTTTVSETRATILGQVACDDATEEAYAARNIASRFSTVPLANPDNALAFLTPLDEEGCRHIRDKLPNPLLRQLRKLAAEERTPSQPTDKPIRPKDAADYYCTTPSEPDQLPIPEGPPY